MKNTHNILAKAIGLLLITAAILKAHQMLTQPIPEIDFFSAKPILIITVEFELALAIWLLSGLLKKAAWLTTLICFCFFSCITLYKGLNGAESCGCFGSVHVNPWLTLCAIDIPTVITLSIFRPKNQKLLAFPPIPKLAITAAITIITIAVTTPILALNKPQKTTPSYQILEPETWTGKKLPIIQYIDIKDKIKNGNWLLLFYHHDCPDCRKAIPKYEKFEQTLKDNKDLLRIAFIEVPPYFNTPITESSPCLLGRLSKDKQWFITTPAVMLISQGKVISAWEAKAPDLETIMKKLSEKTQIFSKFPNFLSTSPHPPSLSIMKGQIKVIELRRNTKGKL